MQNTLIVINFLIAIKKLIAKNLRCNLFNLVMPRTAVTQQHTHTIVTSQLVVCCCDFIQFLVHFYSQVLLIGSFNFIFSTQYVLLTLTSCNTSNTNMLYCTVILCHKLVSLVVVRLIAIKNFNRTAALIINASHLT